MTPPGLARVHRVGRWRWEVGPLRQEACLSLTPSTSPNCTALE